MKQLASELQNNYLNYGLNSHILKSFTCERQYPEVVNNEHAYVFKVYNTHREGVLSIKAFIRYRVDIKINITW